MTTGKVAGVAGPSLAPAPEQGRERFGALLKEHALGGGAGPCPQGETGEAARPSAPAHGPMDRPLEVEPRRAGAWGRAEVRSVRAVSAGPAARVVDAAKLVESVSSAQRRLDHILRLAQSGKTFTPAELLALQAHAYHASQQLDLAGKVVEKATGGVKQVLQTQV
jgi:hypothetical protein